MAHKVYAPFNGNTNHLACYNRTCKNNSNIRCSLTAGQCNNPCGCAQDCAKCTHINPIGESSPIDISSSQGVIVVFYADATVKSIKIKYEGVCATDTGDVDKGVRVQMYSSHNAVNYIGAVYYAHLSNRSYWVSDGQIINKYDSNRWNKGVGSVPALCGCGCYGSYHTHMGRFGGNTNSSLGYGSSVWINSTWIYSW